MFQTLLSPLKARFDQLSPRSTTATTFLQPEEETVQSPEDFARDVLIQLMRNSVDNLKMAEAQEVKTEILGEIDRFLRQDPSTSSVFREMDGFLVVMSVLSAVQVRDAADDLSAAAIECTRRIFVVIDHAMKHEQTNETYFRRHVGYESLSLTLRSLLSDPNTLDPTLGLLLSLAMSDFSLSDYFVALRGADTIDDELDNKLKASHSKLRTVVRPEPLHILWNAILNAQTSTAPVRYGLYKLMESIFHVNHRNQGVLSSLNLVQSLFSRFYTTRGDASIPERERQAQGKLLRRLLEMGATTEDVRRILHKAVIRDEGQPESEDCLDPEVLELIRFGMKSRWSEHFSMEGSSALIVHDSSSAKGLPVLGFTTMLWAYFSSFPAGGSCAIWTVSTPSKVLFKIALRRDGKLELTSSSQSEKDSPHITTASVRKNRWVHLCLVHYPHRGTNPSIRLFIDGVLHDLLNWPYPKADSANARINYQIGDLDKLSGGMSWSLASAYVLSMPVHEDLPRFVHHLGPRYNGNFQDPGLVKFLTYEASTSLNMFLTSVASKAYANPLSPTAITPAGSGSFSIASALSSMSSSSGTTQSGQATPPSAPTPSPGENVYVPASKQAIMQSGLMKVVRYGTGIPESRILFSFTAADCCKAGVGVGQFIPLRGKLNVPGQESASNVVTSPPPAVMVKSPSGEFQLETQQSGDDWSGEGIEVRGDVFIVKAACLDVALWKTGGAAVALRLVQLAKTPHELSRSIGVLVDGLKSSWQNSEDMERLRGYELLAEMLRSKAQMINLTAFETLFEFLGINFTSPEHSTVVNILAYRSIALDFDLWSRTPKEIQQLFLDHFTTLLQISRYKVFNGKQRLQKLGIVRKVLFAIQADWYKGETGRSLITVLRLAAEANFSTDEAIKPLVSYLAANLHEGASHGTSSPYSIISRFEVRNPQEKAEHVLQSLVTTLRSQTLYTRFISALPITRICLLLLGDRPSPFVSLQILKLINICMKFTSAFSRKFELVSGWNVMKTVMPSSWSKEVNEAAFDLLLGRYERRGGELREGHRRTTSTASTASVPYPSTEVVCPQVIPTILSALQHGLVVVACQAHLLEDDPDNAGLKWDMEETMSALLEQIMDLHASSATFREVFRSQQTTQLYIDAYRGYTERLKSSSKINQWNVRMLEKLSHLGLALALDTAVSGPQKREILDILQSADALINPSSPAPPIDPSLIAGPKTTIRQRFASSRLSMQVGERTVIKTMTRMADWRKTIQTAEAKRMRKMVLDMRETRRQVSRLTDWSTVLTSERGLWPRPQVRGWQLDETEGPHRIRKKMEPVEDKPSNSRIDASLELVRDVAPPDTDTLSVHQSEVPPWAESYEVASTDMDDRQLTEEVVDDKLRRIRHDLEPGDVIEEVATVARIVGVDSSPGLLIIGKTHVYMLDGVVENDEGEVIDAKDAPKRLLFIPGSTLEMDGPQKAQRWAHYQIATCSDKKFLFRDVGLEIYFKDSRSLLVVFLDKKRRSGIENRLSAIINKNNSDPSVAAAAPRTPIFGRMGSRVFSNFRADELSSATRRWQAREISNFTYLSILNQISGRTPSDATQYPIFPWVLADYTSSTLDLSAPESYRDLTKPMGALSPDRRLAAETRYSNLASVDEVPFHYGTHFSSSMVVCHYLIRMNPFTHMFKTLQGGDWDLPDRLFSDMARAYSSAALDLRGDVRELIPEFFTCPEFLENYQHLDFGVLQATGEKINDVKLPPWARQDPLLFITMNRRALESSYVSEHLAQWIDLIWGCKQRDPDSLNVFHPLSYEGSVDLDKIKDDLEREATVGIIHNFGQTPRKLFNTPHPERHNHGLSTLPIGTLHGVEEDPHLLTQNERCFRDLGPNAPVGAFVQDSHSDRLIPCAEGTLIVPRHPYEQIEWHRDKPELRVLVDQKIVQAIEGTCTTCASFADPYILATGSSDFTVRLWKVVRGHNTTDLRLSLSNIMRVHTNEVICVATSRAWSLVVSGSKDGSAALWDLNRGSYVRSIWHGSEGEAQDENHAVNLVAINESTGYIATCSKLKLCLHTINGRSIATLDLTTEPSFSSLVPSISSMAFHERDYSYLGILATGGPDGTITLRTWTADGTPENEKAQWEFLHVRTMKAKIGRNGRPVNVTALKFQGETLYHGEETGKSFIWSLPE